MEKVNKIAEPARKTFGHLQKMVRDIKKNEGGFMDKFKKFQNEHVALICKTGKDTWDRITNKGPPNVPRRDYQSEHPRDEDDEWSDEFDSDYENPDGQSDSETYVVPSEDYCDENYEPPPVEAEKKKVSPAFAFKHGDYADKQGNSRQQQVSKPLPVLPCKPSKPSLTLPKLSNQPSPKPNLHSSKPSPPMPSPRSLASSKPQTLERKPQLPPKANEDNMDEEDYIVPVDEEDEEDEDNYIDPTEDSPPLPTKPPVNRSVKPILPGSASGFASAPVNNSKPALYEVIEQQATPLPPPSRGVKPLPPKLSVGGGGPPTLRKATEEPSNSDSSRNNLWKSPPHQNMENTELPGEDEYEICDPDDPDSNGPHVFKPSPAPAPAPVPRTGKKMPIPQNLKPSFPSRDIIQSKEEKPIAVERRKGSGSGPDLPLLPSIPAVIPKPTIPKPTTLPKPPEPASRNINPPVRYVSAGCTTPEQESGVYSQEWYASSCNRKAAEEALQKSNKDGSFLIRKSSGQDSNQPYTLVVFYNRRVYNIPVRYIEQTQQYALGREKSGEERFNSVAEMIENHQRAPLVLIDSQNNTKDSTKLKHAVRVS